MLLEEFEMEINEQYDNQPPHLTPRLETYELVLRTFNDKDQEVLKELEITDIDHEHKVIKMITV